MDLLYFFKQKTSYEMRISDWSSDVCFSDLGEATQIQLLRYGLKASRIDHIFISHMHGDHYFGLPGLLSTLHLNGRVKPLCLYGPSELMEIIHLTLEHSQTQLRYSLEFYPVDPTAPVCLLENQEITRSEEHTSELQSLMRTSYSVFCL